MLIELVFKGTVFHVMLYSIECSRIIKTHVPTEVKGNWREGRGGQLRLLIEIMVPVLIRIYMYCNVLLHVLLRIVTCTVLSLI